MKVSAQFRISILASLIAATGCDQLPPIAALLAGGGKDELPAPTCPTSAQVSQPTGCSDPMYVYQWHLTNTGQNGATVGEDANVKPAWDSGITGKGVCIAVVDDGLEIGHEDLAPNVLQRASYNYLFNSIDPTDSPAEWDDGHGTAVGGVAAAKGASGKGGCGAAPDATLYGYNFLDVPTDINLVNVATRGLSIDSVQNNSWGYDAPGQLIPITSLWEDAVDFGLQNGRGGKGIIYMFAAGNSDADGDMANYDNITNYHGTFAIGAVNKSGAKASYSERGANLLVSAPSGESCTTNDATLTTDRMGANGFNQGSTDYSPGVYDNANPNYTNCFNGTSSATPVVSGVVALMLEANPNLTWRDVRIILARTARVPSGSTGWVTNGGGLDYNPDFGFGVVDAAAAVSMAKTWTSVGGSTNQLQASVSKSTNLPITDNGCGSMSYQTDTINVSTPSMSNVEYIDATVTISNTSAINSYSNFDGNFRVELVSPDGTISVLSEQRNAEVSQELRYGFRFGSEQFLDEDPNGSWQLKVCDGFTGDTGALTGWTLKVYGH